MEQSSNYAPSRTAPLALALGLRRTRGQRWITGSNGIRTVHHSSVVPALCEALGSQSLLARCIAPRAGATTTTTTTLTALISEPTTTYLSCCGGGGGGHQCDRIKIKPAFDVLILVSTSPVVGAQRGSCQAVERMRNRRG